MSNTFFALSAGFAAYMVVAALGSMFSQTWERILWPPIMRGFVVYSMIVAFVAGCIAELL